MLRLSPIKVAAKLGSVCSSSNRRSYNDLPRRTIWEGLGPQTTSVVSSDPESIASLKVIAESLHDICQRWLQKFQRLFTDLDGDTSVKRLGNSTCDAGYGVCITAQGNSISNGVFERCRLKKRYDRLRWSVVWPRWTLSYDFFQFPMKPTHVTGSCLD